MPGHYAARSSPHTLPVAAWPHARVLVVDDHCTYRLLLGSLLEKLGVAHQCCGDGQQALQVLATERFDLVISDCRMPVMDGYALTRELRRREQAEGLAPLVVLGLSGSQGPEEIRRCVECGMDGWLIKPIGFVQLRQVLQRWLPPQSAPAERPPGAREVVRGSTLPSRASLIEAFGAWDVVEPMLRSLIHEAHADLAVLADAQAALDARMSAQCLHRLVGSVAFLGQTGLEAQAVELIKRVYAGGVAVNARELDEFCHAVERYLTYLTQL